MKPDLPLPSLLPITHSCTRISTWGIMLKTTTTETKSTLWLHQTEWQTTTEQPGQRRGMWHFPGYIPIWEAPSSERCQQFTHPFYPTPQISAGEDPVTSKHHPEEDICHPQLLRDKKVKEMSSCLDTKGHHTSLITWITVFWWKSI